MALCFVRCCTVVCSLLCCIPSVEGDVFGFCRNVIGVVPQGAGYHKVGTVPVAGYRDVVYPTLAQQHLYVGFVRLRVKVVDKEYGQVYLMVYYHGGYFGISSERP